MTPKLPQNYAIQAILMNLNDLKNLNFNTVELIEEVNLISTQILRQLTKTNN